MLTPEEQEKALVILGEEHLKLVETLRKALLLGQMGFLKAGQTLAEIKEKKTFKGEDLQHEWTWNDFCSRPDLPFPGRTPESRRRTADALIRIFRVFKEQRQLTDEELAEIGWTKLDLIAPICKKATEEADVQDWLGKAKELTVPNLMAEIKGKDKETFDKLSCVHTDAYQIWYCPNCGARSKKDLRPIKP